MYPLIKSQISIPESRQSDLPTPDLASSFEFTKKLEQRQKPAVEKLENTGRNAQFMSKDGVSLKSNAMTDTVPMIVQRKDIVVT